MLKPKYIETLPDELVALYSAVEEDILADMARRISTYDYWIPSADWQYQKLIEMGNFHSFVESALSARTGKSTEELAQLMAQAGAEALAFDTSVYTANGLTVPALSASKALQKTLNAGLQATLGTFQNLTKTTANTVTGQFEGALDKAWLQIQSGAFSTDKAVQMACKDLASQGVQSITYPSGRTDSLEVAVRRATVTGVNQTCLQLQDQLADELGVDLVETTAHGGARPDHAAWQGQVFSRSGKSKKYKSLRSATGYGTGAGLGGWNCRHSFFPYFEGSPRAYSEELLKDYEAKKYEYNGQKLTEYEASQQQRSIERTIRKWKRENIAMEAAGQDTSESASKLAQWNQTQKDFLKQTGLKAQSSRTQVTGFGRSQASKATAAAKKSESGLKNAAGQRIIEVKKTTLQSEPNTITQVVGKKGGIERNYYGSDGRQYKQVANNNHDNPKQHPYGEHGEHAHDYTYDKDGKVHRTTRELTESERKENGDIL